MPTGVDSSVFYPSPKAKARAELGWGMNERVILFNAGGNPVVKRLKLARAASELVKDQCDSARLLILDGGVPPARVPLYMNASDCLLVTSLFEGSPTIVQEAMACNLPVVSVDVGDVKERLQGVEPSRIVSAEPTQIAQALAEILANPVRSNGTAKLQEISSIPLAEKTLAMYRQALDGQRPSVARRRPAVSRQVATETEIGKM